MQSTGKTGVDWDWGIGELGRWNMEVGMVVVRHQGKGIWAHHRFGVADEPEAEAAAGASGDRRYCFRFPFWRNSVFKMECYQFGEIVTKPVERHKS